MDKYIIGIDLGGRSAKFGLFTEGGELVAKSSIKTRVEDKGKYILEDICDYLDKLVAKHQLTKENLLGIGIGVPGPILNKRVASRAINLGWEEVPVADIIEKRIKTKVYVENDANVAALGEMWKGAAEGKNNVVLVTLGTGVGGGVIVDGKIISGTNGSAGEIGHIPLFEEELDRVCGCGKRNCLEQVASATGIEYLAQDMLLEFDTDSPLRDLDMITAKDIFDYAKQADEISLKVVNKFGKYLGRGLAIISAVVDPEVFVIGGGVSHAGDFLLEVLDVYYKIYAFSSTRDAEITLASPGNDAGMYGAAKLVLE